MSAKIIKMNALQNDINNILNDMQYEHPRYEVISDFFEMSAIAIRNAVSYDSQRAEYEKRYADVAKKYTKKQIQAFSMALARFQDEITLAINGGASFRDWAGELYMESGTYSANFGQFFTPYAVSSVAARVGMDIETIKAKITADSNYIITIQEPTVGAGGLVVAEVECLKNNGINYSWNCFVDCGDIDARCFFMTYLTLSLLGVPAVVRLGDALKLEYRAAWFTPAYIFGYSHFYSRLKNGDYPRAATIPKTQSETKQVTEPPTTKADKYGQLSLLF